jgi:hypothetical protein
MIFSRPARRAPSATEHTADAPEPPVERKLTARGVLREPVARDLARSGEERERDRDVEAGALLLQLRRREVDRAPARPAKMSGSEARADPMFRLLTGAVDEADERERRHGFDDVRLRLDTARLEPDDGERDGARKHAATLRRKV